jgi:phenylacetate-CoA ligase
MRLPDALTIHLLRPGFERAKSFLPRHRAAERAYFEGLRFRDATANWSTAERDGWVLEALRRIVRHAYSSTAYWREVLDSEGFDPRASFGFEDWSRLPVLRRETVQTRLADMVSRVVSADYSRPNATGGSTGQPVHFYMGPEEIGWRRSGVEFSMRRIGAPQGARRAMLWGHHLDPVTRDSLRSRVLDAAANRRWFDCLRLSPDVMDRYDAELRKYRPRCLIAYASALASFAEHLERRGGERPNYPTGCIVTGAEKLHVHQREMIERVFNRPVYERYGSRDVGDMGFQYDAADPNKLNVDWALVLLEPEHEGPEAPVIVTKLHGDATPMLRYSIGDWAMFAAGARPGHPAYEIGGVLGRANDRVALQDGSWVHGIHFPHLFKEFPVQDYQVHQAADFRVRVLLVPGREFTSEHRRLIEANLAANLRGLEVTSDLVDAIPRSKANKWRPVVSEVSRP